MKKVISMSKLDRVKRKMDKMQEALEYCANHARPSIVQDIAREALEYDGKE